MASVPKKVAKRISENLKRFQPVLDSARDRDINESDTVLIVTDMLADIFGYDKYSEITSEHEIRSTFCDLAIIVENDLRFVIEVKAIGLDLKDSHVKQAVDYAANKGVDWALLTNGVNWKVFHITFSKPIGQEMVLDINMLDLNPRDSADIESLFLLAREGLNKSVLAEYHTQLEATNRFILGALLLSEPVLKVIRRELKKLSPDVKIDIEEIKQTLVQDVLKRDVAVGEVADDARKKVKKAVKKQKRAKTAKKNSDMIEDSNQIKESKPEVAKSVMLPGSESK